MKYIWGTVVCLLCQLTIARAAQDTLTLNEIPISINLTDDVPSATTLEFTLTVNDGNSKAVEKVTIPIVNKPGQYPKASDNQGPSNFNVTNGLNNHTGLQTILWDGSVWNGKTDEFPGETASIAIQMRLLDKKNSPIPATVVNINNPAFTYDLSSKVSVSPGSVQIHNFVTFSASLVKKVEEKLTPDTEFRIFQLVDGKLKFVERVQGEAGADAHTVIAKHAFDNAGTYYVHSIVSVGTVDTNKGTKGFTSKMLAISHEAAKIIVLPADIAINAELIEFKPQEYGKPVKVAVNATRLSGNFRAFPEEAHLKITVQHRNGKIASDFNGSIVVAEILSADKVSSLNGANGTSPDLRTPLEFEIKNGALVDGVDPLRATEIVDGALRLYAVTDFKHKESVGVKVSFSATDKGVNVPIPQWQDNIQLGDGAGNFPNGKLKDGNNKIPDWIDFCIADARSGDVSAEAKKLMGRISAFTAPQNGAGGAGIEPIMHVELVPAATQTVIIDQSSPVLRPKKPFTPRYLGRSFAATIDPFITSYIHEARHTWIGYEDSIDGNDKNKNLEPRKMHENVSAPNFSDPDPKGDVRTVVDIDDDLAYTAVAESEKKTITMDGKLMGAVNKTGSGDNIVLSQHVEFKVGSEDLPVLSVTEGSFVIGSMKPLAPISNNLLGLEKVKLGKNSFIQFDNISNGQGDFVAALVLYPSEGFKESDFNSVKFTMTYSFPNRLSNKAVLELDAYTWASSNQVK